MEHNKGTIHLTANNNRALRLGFHAQHLQNVLPKEPQAVSSRSEVDASLTHSTPAVPVSSIHEMPLIVSSTYFFPLLFTHFFLLFSQLDLFFFLYNVFSFFSLFSFQKLSFFLLNLLTLFCFMYLIKFHKHNILFFPL